ncbi:MAG: hypothetical protein CL702_06385 [Chloroflexi bacterium]|nr:hypothetical protein [Chloroflexota bacterium]
MSDQEAVNNMEAVWRSLDELCSNLEDGEWGTPTDCPGWSVQDQLSHLVGSECRLLGRPTPDHVPEETGHVKNDIGQSNEVLVGARRSLSGGKVLEEFREVTGQRLAILRGMTESDFDEETDTPIGRALVRDLLAIRIFDAWVHEQDIRRALGKPGHMDGAVARHAMDRMVTAMPYVLGRKVQPEDGTGVVMNINGLAGRVFAIAMQGNRANLVPSIPLPATVSFNMDLETFACLACGRWEPRDVLDKGLVRIHGDQALGETIVEQLNFMI